MKAYAIALSVALALALPLSASAAYAPDAVAQQIPTEAYTFDGKTVSSVIVQTRSTVYDAGTTSGKRLLTVYPGDRVLRIGAPVKVNDKVWYKVWMKNDKQGYLLQSAVKSGRTDLTANSNLYRAVMGRSSEVYDQNGDAIDGFNVRKNTVQLVNGKEKINDTWYYRLYLLQDNSELYVPTSRIVWPSGNEPAAFATFGSSSYNYIQ